MNARAQLGARQQLALAALLAGASPAEAAATAGVTSRSLRRWLAGDVRFRRALDDGQHAAWRATGRALALAGELAVSTLTEIMRAEAPLPMAQAKTSAARIVLEAGDRSELEQLRDRLEAIEHRLDGGPGDVDADEEAA